MKKRIPNIFLSAVAVLFLLSLTLFCQRAAASTIQLLNWKPVPDSIQPLFPEINYTGANLTTGVGALSNSDGNLPLAAQTPGGLQVDTIVNAPAPYSFPSSVVTGGTGYYDASLTFSGLAPFGPATQTPLPGGILLDAQVLGPGTFTITSTNVAPGPVVLLTGTIVNAVITGIDGGAAGAVIDAHGINYTGGLIFGALPPGSVLIGNDMSISMTSVIPFFGIGGGGQLNPFQADATGLFNINVVPEPTTFVLGLIGAVGIVAGYRRRQSF